MNKKSEKQCDLFSDSVVASTSATFVVCVAPLRPTVWPDWTQLPAERSLAVDAGN